MFSETERISRLLQKTFDKQPWYGSSIMEILGGITPGLSVRRVGESHSIIELVLHMTSWRRFVTKRLNGDETFQVSDETNFPVPGPEPDVWQKSLKALRESQEELLNAVKRFPPERLPEKVPSNSHEYSYYTLLHGIIQHDIYHLGQIALIKKASGS